jgi:hypothetical protein
MLIERLSNQVDLAIFFAIQTKKQKSLSSPTTSPIPWQPQLHNSTPQKTTQKTTCFI